MGAPPKKVGAGVVRRKLRHEVNEAPTTENLHKELLRLEDILDRGRRHGFGTGDVAALERRLNVLATIHGSVSEMMWPNCRELAVICNSLAMEEARGLPIAQDLLGRALALTVKTDVNQQDPERWKLRAVTYNNLACHFRRLAAQAPIA